MKKSIMGMAAYMMAAAMMGATGNPSAAEMSRERKNPYDGETDEERRQRLHKMYGDSSQEHEFVIHGEPIMARDRKTAMKIYARRHQKKK